MDFVPEHAVARKAAIDLYNSLKHRRISAELIATGFEMQGFRKVPMVMKINGPITEDHLSFMNMRLFDPNNIPQAMTEGLIINMLNGWKLKIKHEIQNLYGDSRYLPIYIDEVDGNQYTNPEVVHGLYVAVADGPRHLKYNVFNDGSLDERQLISDQQSKPLLEDEVARMQLDSIENLLIALSQKDEFDIERAQLFQEIRHDTMQRNFSMLNR